MKLTDKMKKILDGNEGPLKQKALELIVRYGRIVEAEALCRVTWADLFYGSHHYLGVVRSEDFDVIFSKMSLCSSKTVPLKKMDSGCICFCGVDADCSEFPADMLMTPETGSNQALSHQICRRRCCAQRQLHSIPYRIHSTHGGTFCQL